MLKLSHKVRDPRTESSTDSSVDNTLTSKVWECFTEILHDSGATTDTDGGKEAMVDRYLSEPLIDYKTGNPYTWWNNNKLRYPLLAKLAKRYLCSPPTSVPSERLFSGAGILYEGRRNKLTAEHAEMLLFIKNNMNLLQVQK